MRKYKIPYFTFYIENPDKKISQMKGTSLFGIPFVFMDAMGQGFWMPMWGFMQYNSNIRSMRKLSDSNLIISLDKIFTNNSLSLEDDLRLIGTIKGMLISIALGGDKWQSPHGKVLQKMLRAQFPELFNNYEFELVDSHIVVNPYENGVVPDAAQIDVYRCQVNNLLRGISPFDLDVNCNLDNWKRDATNIKFLQYIGHPCTLKLPNGNIHRYFAKTTPQFPITLTQVRYNLALPAEAHLTQQEQLLRKKILYTAQKHYHVMLEYFRDNIDANVLSGGDVKFVKEDEFTLLFSPDGHVLAYINKGIRQIALKQDANIFVAISLSLGQLVVVKASKLFEKEDFANLRDVAGQRGIMEIHTLTSSEIRDAEIYYPSIVTPVYECDLVGLLQEYNLTIDAKEKIFATLISGLARIHATSVNHKDILGKKIFHGDLKLVNIFVRFTNERKISQKGPASAPLNPEDIEVYIADLDTMGKFYVSMYTRGYVSPELGEAMHKEYKKDHKDRSWLSLNMNLKQGGDVWALGVAFAMMLQHWSTGPVYNNLGFVERTLRNKDDMNYLMEMAKIKQPEIDIAIQKALNNLPKTNKRDEAILRTMWDAIKSMLQVNVNDRKNIFKISRDYAYAIRFAKSPKLTQSKITDFTVDGKYYKSPTRLQLLKNKLQKGISSIREYLKLLAIIPCKYGSFCRK